MYASCIIYAAISYLYKLEDMQITKIEDNNMSATQYAITKRNLIKNSSPVKSVRSSLLETC